MSKYDLPPEIELTSDGPIRTVRLNRPEQLNATNHVLHNGLAGLFPQIDDDADARAVVITGNGRAFPAGRAFTYLDELLSDEDPRPQSLVAGRKIVTGRVSCLVPVIPSPTRPPG